MSDLKPDEVGAILLNSLSEKSTVSDSEIEEDSFPARLKKVMGDKSIRAFARECGISDTVLRQYLIGQSEPTRPALLAIASTVHVSLDWLIAGQGNAEEPSYKLLDSLLLMAGDIKDVAFLKDWLNQQFPGASGIWMLYYMKDDSMEPTIRKGDLLLVDAGVKDIHQVDNGIYLLRLFGPSVVKRLQRVGKESIEVLHDNPFYKSFSVEISEFGQREAHTLVGQVLWFGRKLQT